MNKSSKQPNGSLFTSRDRLLALIQIMQQHSDEEQPLTLKEIVQYFPPDTELKEATLRLDLQALATSEVFRVCLDRGDGVESQYWYNGVGLKLPELRMLLDAVVAARFIPSKETLHLIEQLKKFSVKRITDEMDNQIYVADEPGVAIKNIADSIHVLHEAINHSNVIFFQYGKYNTAKEFVLNREGGFYKMKPYGLVWSQDFYYLIAQPTDQPIKKHFRVDRMRNISIKDSSFAKEDSFEMNDYLKKLFHMYSGEDIDMVVEFDEHLINVVIDRFGPDADVRPKEDSRFELFTKAIFSDGLVRWLLTWGSNAKVLYPPRLVNRMKEETNKFYNIYH